MKATIEIDDDLYDRLKTEAESQGRDVHELLTEGVRLVPATRPKAEHGRAVVRLPLIDSGHAGKLSIPDDIVSRIDMQEDIERHEASLR